jgi:hypothetical protein
MQKMRKKWDKAWLGTSLVVGLLVIMPAGRCAAQDDGRVAVILDNSSSMSSAGTAFDDIKSSIFETLLIVPGSYEVGLRVFDGGGSRLVSPYSQDLNGLRRALSGIRPESGTYIGQSLKDAAEDLLEQPEGTHRLVLVTDGEGDTGDIADAREAKDRLSQLEGGFKCHFVLFSTKRDVWNETPIGQIADSLGCGVTVPGAVASARTLTPTLLRIFGFDFYWIWIILSALLYLVLLLLTAPLVFDAEYAQGVRPKVAWLAALGFFFGLLPPVIGAHVIGLFSRFTGLIWGLVIFAMAMLILAAIGIGKGASKKGGIYDPNDPFA